MNKRTEQQLDKIYFAGGQYLLFESHYVDEGKLTSQQCCVIDKKKNRCVLCVVIRTFSDIYDYQWGHTPYFYEDSANHEVIITIPKFGFLTKVDIANALKYTVRKLGLLVFNIKLDGENQGAYATYHRKLYQEYREDLKLEKIFRFVNEEKIDVS